MAKGEKVAAKIERARALATEELGDARAKAERKVRKARATLRDEEQRIQARLEKALAKLERKRDGKRLSAHHRRTHDPLEFVPPWVSRTR